MIRDKINVVENGYLDSLNFHATDSRDAMLLASARNFNNMTAETQDRTRARSLTSLTGGSKPISLMSKNAKKEQIEILNENLRTLEQQLVQLSQSASIIKGSLAVLKDSHPFQVESESHNSLSQIESDTKNSEQIV